MAKRYSAADQKKILQDRLGNLNAKGVVEITTFHNLHPGGPLEALKVMEQDQSFVKEQSQQQIEHGREKAREMAKNAEATAEENRDLRRKD